MRFREASASSAQALEVAEAASFCGGVRRTACSSGAGPSSESACLVCSVMNLLMRRETKLLERNIEYADHDVPPMLSAGDIAVVFPSEAGAGAGERPEQTRLQASAGRIDLPVDQAGSDVVSMFTRKAAPDCVPVGRRFGAGNHPAVFPRVS